MSNYVPYHVHSDYSLLDSCTNFQDYVDKAVACGMPAIAFSEHGKLSGWVKKKQYCDKKGIKYIHAVEVYITERLEPKVRDNYHTVLIAKNLAGVKELNAIISKSFDEQHFYYTNRISIDEFLSLSSNIITTSACLASPLNKLDPTHEKYEALVKRYDYLEVQAHAHQEQIDFNVHLACIAEKSSKALSAFMTIVEDLKKTNTEADSIKAANDAVIAAKQQENEMITTVKSQNEKIIQNIENMLAL